MQDMPSALAACSLRLEESRARFPSPCSANSRFRLCPSNGCCHFSQEKRTLRSSFCSAFHFPFPRFFGLMKACAYGRGSSAFTLEDSAKSLQSLRFSSVRTQLPPSLNLCGFAGLFLYVLNDRPTVCVWVFSWDLNGLLPLRFYHIGPRILLILIFLVGC